MSVIDLPSLLERHEARRQFVYDDKNGLPLARGMTIQGAPTIGVGRNLATKGLSKNEINMLLQTDIAECMTDLTELFGHVFLSAGTPRRAALCDMRFTLGQAGFREFTAMIAAVQKEDWDAAAVAVLDSAWARTGSPTRAREDATLLKTQQWPSS